MTLCSTEEFWKRMCDARFLRMSLYMGRIGREEYVTLHPPEHVPGFLDAVVARIRRNLGA